MTTEKEWTLTARRECCEMQTIAVVTQSVETDELIMEGMKDIVDDLEEDGEWPEGYEAILCCEDSRSFLYTDKWEPLEGEW